MSRSNAARWRRRWQWRGSLRAGIAGMAAIALSGPACAIAAPPSQAPTDLTVTDQSLDEGEALVIEWQAAPGAAEAGVTRYEVKRSLTDKELKKLARDLRVAAAQGIYDKEKAAAIAEGVAPEQAGERAQRKAQAFVDAIDRTQELANLQAVVVPAAALSTTAAKNGHFRVVLEKLKPGHPYRIEVSAEGADGAVAGTTSHAPVAPHVDPLFYEKLPLLGWLLVICASVIFFVLLARAGRPMRIRRIAALEAIDEAVGRATEMGRSVLFIPGIQDMDNVQTVAGITILSKVAKTAAEYDASLEVPNTRSLVMQAAREAVQASYMEAGRTENYNPDAITYITDEQFGFVAYAAGRMVRTKPAACIYMGCFYAESLILAETGNSIGAIQIAGTAETTQLPFFVAACDYTLIGEEFFAASAYLSGQPDQIGSLKGQDVGKALAILVLIICGILTTLAGPPGGTPSLPKSMAQTSLEGVKDALSAKLERGGS